MPEMNGDDVCRHVRQVLGDAMLPIIVVTGSSSADQLERSFAAGATDFVRKPYQATELIARVESAVGRKRLTDQLDSAEEVMFALARMVEARDGETGDHCSRLAELAVRFGGALGLGPEQLLALRRGGVLHDIGKLGIPDRVLLKRGPLDDDEWAIMRTHTLIGDRLCASLRSLHLTAPIVRSHHERWDGSGYPDGLVGEQIPLLARVFQLCDIFDALTNARAYKGGMSAEEALAIMQGECDRGWRDPALMRAFHDLVTQQPDIAPPAVEEDDLGRTLFTAVVATGSGAQGDAK
jgi:putative two-component system response regulator